MNSSATKTLPIDTKPAYHCTKFGHPVALTRVLISFKSCSLLSLSCTLIDLIATETPLRRILPLNTTPHAPDPRRALKSISMSSTESLYSWPAKVIPRVDEKHVPVGLWCKVPFIAVDQLADNDPSQLSNIEPSKAFGFSLLRGPLIEGEPGRTRRSRFCGELTCDNLLFGELSAMDASVATNDGSEIEEYDASAHDTSLQMDSDKASWSDAGSAVDIGVFRGA
mmetsp:Transcript_32113/g.73450  ORF Transcript_32113/g.73450 Transcript_32113/m.73450 type:complete len:224 (-) Transcript_32113:195-866(-)